MNYDCFDLNFDICSEEWATLDRLTVKKCPSILEGGLRFFFFFFKSFLKVNLFASYKEHVFLIGTYNQEVALDRVFKKTHRGKKIYFHNFKANGGARLPELLFYVIGLLFLPWTLRQWSRGSSMQKNSLIRRLERFVVSGPSVFTYKILFLLWQPKSVIVSNDHNHWTRAAVKAAKSMNISTFYIPHAFTNESFPPLEADISFLDSELQAMRYRNLDSQIHIVGSVRLEDKIAPLVSLDIKGMIICFNDEDKTDFIFKILESLPQKTEWHFFVKPHPADKSRFELMQKKCIELGIDYISPQKSVCDYRSKASVVLAGISGVHVDALMCGMMPATLKCWYHRDYYKLLEDRLLILKDDIDSILKISNLEYQEIFSRRYLLNWHLKDTRELPSEKIARFLNAI